MSEEQNQELDARGAAFALRPNAFTMIEWGGFRYEVRPATLAFQRELSASQEDPTTKAVKTIIACTFWPPGHPSAGKPMFTIRDRDLIMNSYGDGDSLWMKILKTISEDAKRVAAKDVVREITGNSEASPS